MSSTDSSEPTKPPSPNRCPRCNKVTLVTVQHDGLTSEECLCGFISDEATEWLEKSDVLSRFQEAICAEESDDPLVGERDTAVHLLMVVMAKGSAEVHGNSSGGKNTLVDHVLEAVPRSWWMKITGMSDKAIRNLPSDIRILYVAERRHIGENEESNAEFDMKLGMSEGTLAVAVSEKQDNGRYETKIRKVVVGSFISTSPDVAAPPQLENRLHILAIRDDPAQNERVRDEQLKRAKLPSWSKRDYLKERKIARRALEIIDKEAPPRVIIPYAESLKPILDTRSTNVRRNTPKLLNLIEASARIHYRQRPRIKGPDGQEDIVSMVKDLEVVLSVGSRALKQTLNVMTEKLGSIIEVCRAMDKRGEAITTRGILTELRDSKTTSVQSAETVREIMRLLEDRGVVLRRLDDEGRQVKAFHGAYVYDFVDPENGNLVIDENALLDKAQDETIEWLGAIGEQNLILSDASTLSPSSPEPMELNPVGVVGPIIDPAPSTGSNSSSGDNPAVGPLIGATSIAPQAEGSIQDGDDS